MRRAMARLMKAYRFQVTCVGSVEALLAQDLPTEGAVIVADVSTANQCTSTLYDLLRERERTLPVIYVTDFDTEHARREAKRMGAAGYFRKPVDQLALVDAITFAAQQWNIDHVN
jgi:FixJ family two-component response regulator